jgi:lysophospholipase L1-like esterase
MDRFGRRTRAICLASRARATIAIAVQSPYLPASLALILLVGCGEGASTVRVPGGHPADALIAAARVVHPDAERDEAVVAPARATRALPADGGGPSSADATLSSAPIGHLYGPNLLTHVFESLAGLDDGHSHEDVRILQYGDSHTASDLGVGVFRRALQARFGDGGRGFVSIGRPWKGYGQDGIRGGMTREFEPTKVKFHKDRTFTGIDGCYGLLGVGIETTDAGARAWTDVATHASHIEIDYGQEPQGGSFDVTIDGSRAGRVATRAAQPGSGQFSLDVADTPHHVELRAVGDGRVRVFGMTLDRPEAGVVVDALGINGAQIFTPLRWNEAHFADQLRHASPALIVVAYGTNEALEPGLGDTEYERKLVDFLGRIARATPTASCILLGPPDLARHTPGQEDWHSLPRLAAIVAVQRKVAEAAGCAFYDQQEAMGGPGSIVSWAAEAEPRAQRDRVHLTRTGYAQVATSFADDLVRAYGEWRAGRGLSPMSERTSSDSGSPAVSPR